MSKRTFQALPDFIGLRLRVPIRWVIANESAADPTLAIFLELLGSE